MNVIKQKACRQSFYRNTPNKSEDNECNIYNNIESKTMKLPELELELDENNSSTFHCIASKKEGNLRYLLLDSQGLKWTSLKNL